MPLFRLRGRAVVRISPQDQRIKEEIVHRLIEENLDRFFEDFLLVARKPRIGGKEFDTLAVDRTTSAPVIIEYKREKDRGVFEQVDLYYVKLKHNKPDVMILLQKSNAVEDLEQVDFENPQIVIVAKEFTPEQRELLTLKKDYLRLFRYQFYDDKIVSLEQVEPLTAPSEVASGARRIAHFPGGTYDLDHFGMNPSTRQLYEKLDKGILSLDSRVKPGKILKYFIGYAATGPYFCSVKPRVKSLRVEVKCHSKPGNYKRLHVYALPEYRTMTHGFDMSSEMQMGIALRIIKQALTESL
ncbi:MAG: hypothetical protein HY234_01155 [Acidobacteria bacterium]|nr:hypothetical protein [Acidobacteriota bacterium]